MAVRVAMAALRSAAVPTIPVPPPTVLPPFLATLALISAAILPVAPAVNPTVVAVITAAGLMAKLWSSGQEAAFRVLVEVTLSLVIVFGVHRAHLLRSEALSLLARAALIGVVGALVVAALR